MLSNLLKLKTITYAKQLVQRTPRRSRPCIFQRHISRLRSRRVEELEQEALNDKLNPDTQLRFLKELNKGDPHAVVIHGRVTTKGEARRVSSYSPGPCAR